MRVSHTGYRPRDPWGTCMVCGFDYRLSELSLRWDNLRVCKDDFDPRPPELSPPNVYPEGLPRPDASPEMPVVFITTPVTPDDL